MAVLRLRRKSGGRPPVRIRGINWASPFADGLIFGFDPSHQANRRTSLIDLVSEASLVPELSSSNAVIEITDLGPAFRSVSGGNDGWGTTTGANKPVADTTISAWVRPANIGAFDGYFRVGDATEWTRLGVGTGGEAIHTVQGSTQRSATSVNTIAANQWVLIAGRSGSTGATDVWLNGAQEDTDSGHSLSQVGAAIDVLNSFGGFEADGWMRAALLWDHRLSAPMLHALYDPRFRWDVFDTGYRYISLPAAAGGAGGRRNPLRGPLHGPLAGPLAA